MCVLFKIELRYFKQARKMQWENNENLFLDMFQVLVSLPITYMKQQASYLPWVPVSTSVKLGF